METKIPTCGHPTDEKSLYMRCMYRTYFFGPFKDIEELTAAINYLDKVKPMWDNDGFCIVYGANPLPEDYVFGFRFIDSCVREQIEKQRVTMSYEDAIKFNEV